MFAACETGEFVSYGAAHDLATRWHQGPGKIDEFWIMDVDASIVVLNALYRPDTLSALVDETRGIVESTRFEAE